MAKTKISEFSTTAGNNTDINSINIAEGCAPSGINDAIRELMRQLKEFQTGGAGDSVNSGGDFSVATNKFTVASASGNTAVAGTLAVTGTTTLTGALVANGNATLGDGSGDTVTVKGTPTLEVNPTLSGGTANGVLYLNGSKVATSGSALTFDGTNLGLSGTGSRFINLGSTSTNGQSVALQISAPNSDASASVYRIGSGLTADNEWVVYDVTNTQTVDKYIRGASGFRALFINGSEQMRLTSTGLGIGTSSPGYKLDVDKGSAGLVARFKGGTRSAYIYSDNDAVYFTSDTSVATAFGVNETSDILTFFTNNAERARIDSSGNLGLGVTPSAWGSGYKSLDIGSVASFFSDNNVTANVSANQYIDAGGRKYKTTNYATMYQQYNGEHQWYTAASGTAGNAISFTQAMTLDASGNLGVGTTSPSGRLHIATGGETTSRFDGSRGSADNLPVVTIPFWNVSNGVGDKQIATIGVLTGTSSNQTQKGQIYFSTSDGTLTERARIDSSGNLLVGTTSVINAGKLSVSFDGATQNGIVLQTTLASTGSKYASFLNSAGTEAGNINQNGTTTVQYATSSDYRLKENVQPMTGALNKVAQLKPVTYTWKSDGTDGQGFIAHELQEVVPECVSGEKDAVDAEGNPVYQGIDTSFLVATLTAAIQEQQAQIESLRKRLADAGIA